MTKADDFENRTVGWWLKQLSLRQLWGLLAVLGVLLLSVFSAGVWLARAPDDANQRATDEQPKAIDEARLPEGLTAFDIEVLRILAEPHQDFVPVDYVAYRLKASSVRVEGSIEKLAQVQRTGSPVTELQIVWVHRTEGGDMLGALLSPGGVKYMDEHKLYK